jgi:hypothetical protein
VLASGLKDVADAEFRFRRCHPTANYSIDLRRCEVCVVRLLRCKAASGLPMCTHAGIDGGGRLPASSPLASVHGGALSGPSRTCKCAGKSGRGGVGGGDRRSCLSGVRRIIIVAVVDALYY